MNHNNDITQHTYDLHFALQMRALELYFILTGSGHGFCYNGLTPFQGQKALVEDLG